MAHSKRNTSLAFFTSHERSLLKSSWGSRSTRLSRDSFLPFASCMLCLLPSRSPVACASNGDIFCRECALANILAQRKEIKRLEKEEERRRVDEEEEARKEEGEAQERAVWEFERVQVGLEGKLGSGGERSGGGGAGERDEDGREEEEKGQPRGKKRKFELDEHELLHIASSERARTKQTLQTEKSLAATPRLPSFWVPSITPSSNTTNALHHIVKAPKLHPVCPASALERPHHYSLKTLVDISFAEEKDEKSGLLIRVCPSCNKPLSNSLKAILTVPCGHVLCKPCATKFMQPVPRDPHSPAAAGEGAEGGAEGGSVVCYVCSTSLTERPRKRGRESEEKEKDRLKPGLVELKSEGTGFAGAGKNTVQRQGVAFQC
ncbi:MAG: hypothetical protein M1824_002077 [Vezdaea acicularis]|nr:MAG: hypothetical protein M1824_002077 [Vezdaea acicularis]